MDSKAPVLAIEFRGVRETADFSFLTKRLGSERVHRLDPLVDHVANRLTIPRQARSVLDRLPAPPETVVAYCACAALGAHIAALCDARLVLVDPDAVTAEAVRRDFANLCETLGYDQPQPSASEEADPHAQWEDAFREARPRLAEAQGGDAEAFEMVDDLFDRYRGWLRFIDATANAGPVRVTGDATVIVRKPLTDLQALLTLQEHVRFHRVDAESATLDAAEIQDLVLAAVPRSRP